MATPPSPTVVLKRGSFSSSVPRQKHILIVASAHPPTAALDGRLQPFSAEKVTAFRRLRTQFLTVFFLSQLRRCIHTLSWELQIDLPSISSLVDDIATSLTGHVSAHELQIHTAAAVAASCTKHPHFSKLAGRIFVAALHKTTEKTFSTWVDNHADGPDSPFCATFLDLVKFHGTDIDNAVVHARDFDFAYSSIRTLNHTYLLRVDGVVVERPQYLYMRVALIAHGKDLQRVLETYEALSCHRFTPASPVLFNAGTRSSNYASCFLYMPDASNPSTQLRSASDLDNLWLADGGIGLSLSEIPAKRTHPRPQPGIQPLLRVYDAHAEYTGVHRHKRPSAATVHLPIWHADVRSFVVSRTNQAPRRLRHLYPSLWVPDVFMQRLQLHDKWSLFDPRDVPLLQTSFGDDFTRAYEEYERTVTPLERIGARDLWNVVCRAQQESGTPFLMYQDSVNAKNNQQHLGVVRTSNLCTEIVQFSSSTHTAVCTLASIAVARFVQSDRTYDFAELHSTVRLAVLTTNALLDQGTYPDSVCAKSVADTRAIGIGVQGLADTFMASELPFHSNGARQLNREIFETIYHAAYETSCELAAEHGAYPLYSGSPAAQGTLQHDMWNDVVLSGRYDFDVLRANIRVHGLRNSMLTAQMPTASTAKLLGNFDGTEPYTSNIVTHRVLSGDYTEICPWLVSALTLRGLWTEDIRVAVLRRHGSVQDIPSIPLHLKELFMTAWELDPKVVIDMAADRGPFIDQTQSMSLAVAAPTPALLLDLQMHAWKRGLKTGLYYLRTQAPAYPLPFGVGALPSTSLPGGPDRPPAVFSRPTGAPVCDSCDA
ncbi:alpha subunit of ribonucleoside-diphosphate reductase [Lentinus brumalis]|uniref:Ribonucleoside-diphosphate reductase n=1 Tax=Lentinus brumalis TaxID=2498619 RepID=A0A371D4I8_9APHY|nr:alpha subunit of ribonucleoside-diphosphate reductase [Polyporus brumalis]